MKPTGRACCLVLAMAMVMMGTACAQNDRTEKNDSQLKTAPYETKLFDVSCVHTIDISILETDWADLKKNPREKTKYPVDVTIDGETVEQVSFATKGNTSLSFIADDPDSDRYSFKINFGKYVPGQTYYGLNKLSLNNLYADATCMKDYLSYRIFRQAGVKAPLASYAWLTINGEDHGLYLAIEDMSESYLERTQNGEGALYKPETEQLDNMNKGENRSDDADGSNRPGIDGQPPQGWMQPPDGAFFGQSGQPDAPGQTPDPNDGQRPSPPGEPGTMPFAPGDGAKMPSFPGNGGPQDGPMLWGAAGFGTASHGADLKYTGDDLDSYSDIFNNAETRVTAMDQRRVVEALKALSEGENVGDCLDTDEIIRYFAAHNFVLNYDSYTGNMLHNYYLYERDGKLSMLPWDYNLAFGAFGGGQGGMNADGTQLINTGIDTPLSGARESDRPMWSWIPSDETYLKRYHEVYDELLKAYFESGDFEKEIDAVYELIRPYVKKDPSAFYTADEFETGYRALKKVCLLRAQSVRAQLDGRLSRRTDEQRAEDRVDASDVAIGAMGTHGGRNGQAPGRDPITP